MTLSERFICPLIELIHLHIDVSDGLAVIQEIIESQAGREGLTDDEVHKKLQDLWVGRSMEGSCLRCLLLWNRFESNHLNAISVPYHE